MPKQFSEYHNLRKQNRIQCIHYVYDPVRMQLQA